MTVRRAALVLLLGLVVAACAGGAGASPGAAGASVGPSSPPAAGSAPPASLMVFAAASLRPALEKAKAAYEAAHAGTTLTISTDSSSALEAKIEQGAPADLFLSADTANPRKLVDKGLAAGGVVTFAANLLAVIVPTANPAGIRTPADLARRGVKIIAAGENVPITKYATQLIANLAKQAGYPADFTDAYAANVVTREDNVSAIVNKVELGEGDAGIVYVTDAGRSSKVSGVPLPDAANVPATYGGVVVRASANRDAATAFLGWLAGPEGQAVLARFGFLPPP